MTAALMVLGAGLLVFAAAGSMFVASLRERPTPPPAAPQMPPVPPRTHRRDDGPMAMVQAPDGVWRFR